MKPRSFASPCPIAALFGPIVVSIALVGTAASQESHDDEHHHHHDSHGEQGHGDVQSLDEPRLSVSGALDLLAEQVETDEPGAGGLDLSLRTLEMHFTGQLDTDWQGYAVVVYADEELEVEEVAVDYLGFGVGTELRLGRFFVDFGTQMTSHVHELPYPDRPGVLAEYLGHELPGVGIQAAKHWTTGERSEVHASLGLFSEFDLGGHEHGGEEEEEHGAELHGGPKDVSEFGLTARVAQTIESGVSDSFTWGASLRHIGAYSAENEGTALVEDDLATTTFGVDGTYNVESQDDDSGWTVSAEYLMATGDIGAGIHDDRGGYYAWAERRTDAKNAYGLLLSSFEHLEENPTEETQITAYYTRNLSERARLRFALSHASIDEAEDATRFLVQLTTFFGQHTH